MPLLLVDERPKLVGLDERRLNIADDRIVQAGAGIAQRDPKTHNRIPMDAEKPLGPPDTQPVDQGGGHLHLLLKSQPVHVPKCSYIRASRQEGSNSPKL